MLNNEERRQQDMVNTSKLKGVIVANDKTQEEVAKAIGITPKTFYLKMKKGVFGSDEIEKMIKLLNIDDPISIFFANEVT
jgi:DNA-binding XRE family transcriptional regulator